MTPHPFISRPDCNRCLTPWVGDMDHCLECGFPRARVTPPKDYRYPTLGRWHFQPGTPRRRTDAEWRRLSRRAAEDAPPPWVRVMHVAAPLYLEDFPEDRWIRCREVTEKSFLLDSQQGVVVGVPFAHVADVRHLDPPEALQFALPDEGYAQYCREAEEVEPRPLHPDELALLHEIAAHPSRLPAEVPALEALAVEGYLRLRVMRSSRAPDSPALAVTAEVTKIGRFVMAGRPWPWDETTEESL